MGAVATAPPGPFVNGVSGALNPTGSATLPSLSVTPTQPAPGSSTASSSGSAASTSPTSAAMSITENLKMGVVAAAAGLAVALM